MKESGSRGRKSRKSENIEGRPMVGKNSSEGFAQAVSTLEKLNRLESDIATIISSYKVPIKEARKFLRCTTPEQLANISLFQYMKALFVQLGIDIDITRVEPFVYLFHVKDSAISNLYSGIKGRTCYLICEAIARFFNRDLNLSVSVEETQCVNNGDEMCLFETRVNKEDFCTITLSDEEKRFLAGLANSNEVSTKTSLSQEELDFMMDMFQRYNLINEVGKVTQLGVRCASQFIEEEEIESPWSSMSNIASAISNALSFAEATYLSLSAESRNPSETDRPLSRKKVRSYRSFAELLAKQVVNESSTEGI